MQSHPGSDYGLNNRATRHTIGRRKKLSKPAPPEWGQPLTSTLTTTSSKLWTAPKRRKGPRQTIKLLKVASQTHQACAGRPAGRTGPLRPDNPVTRPPRQHAACRLLVSAAGEGENSPDRRGRFSLPQVFNIPPAVSSSFEASISGNSRGES